MSRDHGEDMTSSADDVSRCCVDNDSSSGSSTYDVSACMSVLRKPPPPPPPPTSSPSPPEIPPRVRNRSLTSHLAASGAPNKSSSHYQTPPNNTAVDGDVIIAQSSAAATPADETSPYIDMGSKTFPKRPDKRTAAADVPTTTTLLSQSRSVGNELQDGYFDMGSKQLQLLASKASKSGRYIRVINVNVVY